MTAWRLAKPPTPCEIAPVSAIVMTMSSIRQPIVIGDDLRQRGALALALVGRAGRDRDLAVLQHADGDAFERAEPGAFDIVCDPDADVAALRHAPWPGARGNVS